MCAQIRRNAFSRNIPYDHKLSRFVDGVSSHRFLSNPASQNTYLYQVEFVKDLSESKFNKPLSGLSILDWGCGKGHVSYLLRQMGANLTSCDYFAETAGDDDSTFGQEVPIIKATGIKVDKLTHSSELPYPNHSFDVLLSFGVLEHVPNDIASLKEIHRVLRPGGILFCFNLPYVLSWTQRVMHAAGNEYHDRLYSKNLTRELLNSTSFKTLEIWHRQLFPKNRWRYPFYRRFESLDQALVRYTPLRYFATNIEFAAIAT